MEGDDGLPPPTVLERQRKLEEQMSSLAAAVEVMARASTPPPARRQSIPARAAVGGYRLTKSAALALGILVAVGECAARRAGIDATPIRQAVDAIVVPDHSAPASSAH